MCDASMADAGGRWSPPSSCRSAWASPASAETTLQIDAGYAGSFVAGQEVPVRVRVSADRLMRGTLEVGIGSAENAAPVAMPVEVPGGSQKEFLIVAPSGPDTSQSPDVVARLLQGDQVVASGRMTVRPAVETELVGLLPGALRGRPVPGPAPLAVDAGTARFAAIGAGDLEQAPASLGPLSTLVADVDEIGRLAPGARAGVLRWMEDGGRLLVDSARGQVVPGLPDAWQPGARGRAAAGLGEVVATGGAVAAGRWSGLVEPSGRGTVSGRLRRRDAPGQHPGRRRRPADARDRLARRVPRRLRRRRGAGGLLRRPPAGAARAGVGGGAPRRPAVHLRKLGGGPQPAQGHRARACQRPHHRRRRDGRHQLCRRVLQVGRDRPHRLPFRLVDGHLRRRRRGGAAEPGDPDLRRSRSAPGPRHGPVRDGPGDRSGARRRRRRAAGQRHVRRRRPGDRRGPQHDAVPARRGGALRRLGRRQCRRTSARARSARSACSPARAASTGGMPSSWCGAGSAWARPTAWPTSACGRRPSRPPA